MEIGEQRQHNLPHLWMGGIGTPEGEDMSPLPEVGSHYKLCFHAVGEYGAGTFRGFSHLDQNQVGILCSTHKNLPCKVRDRINFPETRCYEY